MKAIYTRELKSYFNTLAGYIFVFAFLITGGTSFAFANLLAGNSKMDFVLESLQYAIYLLTPLLTARMVYGECGIDRTLFSAPVKTAGIVAARFFAVFTVLACSVALSFVYPLILAISGIPFAAETVAGYAGLILFGGSLIAAGMFISSMAATRLKAGVTALAVMLLMMLSQQAIPGMKSAWLKEALILFTPSWHLSGFYSGIIGFSALVYYLSSILLFIVLTIYTTERRRRGH